MPPFRGRNGALNPKGYTFIEVAMAIAILGTAIATVTTLYRVFSRALIQAEEKTKLHHVLTFSMEQMVTSIRQARAIEQLGPVTISGGSATIGPCTYSNGEVVLTMPMTTVHLGPSAQSTPSTARRIMSYTLPHSQDPLQEDLDTTVNYFMRQQVHQDRGQPVTTYRLYQQMVYYTGDRTEAFPVMLNIDRYRNPGPQPPPGCTPEPPIDITPTPTTASPTPTPVFVDNVGRMPGAYGIKDLSYDDVAFYYDPFNQIITVGLTVSVKAKTRLFFSSALDRRRATLTTSVALRRSGQGGCP